MPDVLRSLHEQQYKIVIITNEIMDRLKKSSAIEKTMLKKTGRLEGFLAQVRVPAQVFCATAKDDYRKPEPGTWRVLLERNGGIEPDLKASFYVGDAAGRKGDFSDSDKKFAEAVGLPFYDEKEFFEVKHKP